MSKLKHVTKKHIEQAIKLYSEEEAKEKWQARPTKDNDGYEVFYEGELYPLKHLMGVADKISLNGNSSKFNTHCARNYFVELDFTVIVSRENVHGEIERRIYGSNKIFTESDNEENLYPDEIKEVLTCYSEGAKKQVTVNAYERDVRARKECLRAHGYMCKICSFSFGKKYGKKFQYKIHVHHIKPLSEIQENYEVDPVKDLVPVCPNCHMILHSKGSGETYTIDKVKDMLV